MERPVVEVRIDTREFEATLKRYAAVSKTSFPDIVNRKLRFIARGATRLTPKAKASDIRSSLRQEGARPGQTLAESIVRAKLYRQGKKQPTKIETKALVKAMIGARIRSIGYIKSGWLPAIAKLGAALGLSSSGGGQGRQFGKPKGNAVIAKSGWKVFGSITNEAYTRHDPKALEIYGAPALQQAVNNETVSTQAEIEKRMRQDLTSLGIAHHG